MRIPIPANVDIPDKILWGLTVRQAALLAPVAIGLIAAWHALGGLVSTPVLVGLCGAVGIVAVVVVLGKRDGVSLDRLLWAAIRHPRSRLAAGHPDPTAALDNGATSRVETVRAWSGPVRAITDTGLDLGPRGVAVGLDARGVNFALRSPDEQHALVQGMTRILNACTSHLQIVVSIRPSTLDSHVDRLRQTHRHMKSASLRQAGRTYVAWLADLDDATDMQRREITIVVTGATEADAARAATAVIDGCGGLGATCRVLTGGELAARVRAHVDPATPTPGDTSDTRTIQTGLYEGETS
ncbi:MAG TPA: PrgI family protein [Stackebrandtia sp.]|jgi:hypothetical protein|uniref:PrgI family protein n=1 Tax=Stackebrandtia sp. TaxID=2023065 RepID=UPI002D6FC9AF|nr:PrgI family protein [Stackebrandtia sp.]HZE41244.1 PrgI family protein [Stackebrandtia sp.]